MVFVSIVINFLFLSDDNFIPSKSDNNNSNNNNLNVRNAVLTNVSKLNPTVMSKLNHTTTNSTNVVPRKVLPANIIERERSEMKAMPNRKVFHKNHKQSILKSDQNTKKTDKRITNSESFVLSSTPINVVSTTSGDGLHIIPTRASVFPRASTDNLIAPVTSEINSSNEIRVSKIKPVHHEGGIIVSKNRNTSKNAKLNARFQLQQEVSGSQQAVGFPLEASFSDINDHSTVGNKMTPALEQHFSETSLEEQAKNVKTNSKILTIATDAFLIRGMSSISEQLVRPEVTVISTPTFTQVPASLAVSIDNNASQNVVEDGNLIKEFPIVRQTEATIEIMSIPKLVINTEAPLQIHYSMAPALKEYPTNRYQHLPDPVVKVNNSRIDVKLEKAAAPELKEVFDVPVKESLINDNAIEWVNIFNVPKETVNTSVGDISGLQENTHPVTNLERVHTVPHDFNANINSHDSNAHSSQGIGDLFGEIGTAIDGFVADAHNRTSSNFNIDLADTHLQNVMKFFDRIMGDDSVTQPVSKSTDSVLAPTLPPSVVVRNRNDGRNLLNSGYYSNQLDSNIQLMNQMQQMTNRMVQDNLQNVMNLVSQPRQSILGTEQMGVKRNSFRQSVPVIQKTSQSLFGTVNQSPIFQLRAGFYNGRPAVIVGRPVTNLQQPWQFLQRIEQASQTRPRTTRTSHHYRPNKYTNHRQGHGSVIVHRSSSGYGLNQVVRWKYPSQSYSASVKALHSPSPNHQPAQPHTTNMFHFPAQESNSPGIVYYHQNNIGCYTEAD